MLRGVLRTVKYARVWRSGADVLAEETEIQRDGTAVPATLVLPARRRGPLPGWIALGGMSRMGRFHPQLVRFANALASTGAAVLLPEIPEWTSLKVSPWVTGPTIRGCMDVLERRSEVRAGKFGLIGFSFGGPQVAIAAAREELADRVAGIVLFGAYCDLERTMICQLAGEHEWEGTDYTLSPDPYGRWVVASNHLTDVPGCEDASDVAAALHRLAATTSEQRVSAWGSHHDPMIGELRLALPMKRRGLFDLFATPTTAERPEREECLKMAKNIAEACRRVEPLLEPARDLARVNLPTRLIHGRGDRLVPFTEGLRLMEGLPVIARKGVTVTELFNHSADHSPASLPDRIRETMLMFRAMRGMINTV